MSQALASKSLSQAYKIVADYSLSIKPSAAKGLQSISDKATLTRLIEKVKSLDTQPRWGRAIHLLPQAFKVLTL